ncbi:transposase [Dictyobacter formicarum]|uniref:transposase n=1 Tax=Dictyobacter formicarum TaxID=2778368 RepID=UPI001915E08C|nr:transposase [Dictyobacter formicarum]
MRCIAQRKSSAQFARIVSTALFIRQWPSLHQALHDGHINVDVLREAGITALLKHVKPHEPVWISVDSSNIARSEAHTSAHRGIIYVSNLPRCRKPINVGWQFSTVMLLPEEPSSWVGILDQQRIASHHTAVENRRDEPLAFIPNRLHAITSL